MITKNTLTGDRKIMNMQKVGTVVQSKSGHENGENPRKHRAGELMRYTLCVIQERQRRNSFRYGFALNPLKAFWVCEPAGGRRAAKPPILLICLIISVLGLCC